VRNRLAEPESLRWAACNNRRMPLTEPECGTESDPSVDRGPSTDRVRLRRLADQGSHSRADLEAVLDAGFICHLGLDVDGWPMVVPTTYGRSGAHLYLHGSVASRSLRSAKAPAPVCVTVTLVDGLVLARSVFNHSVNYRCAMVFGLPDLLVDPDEKLAGLEAISEHAVPGQWGYARSPSIQELAKTTVLRLALDEASVKVSEGPPDDDATDLDLDVWAGVIPLRTARLAPVAASDLQPGVTLPEHIASGPLAPGSDTVRDLD
jgi:nitroimidazol reductase NimA-like FMN-containing flavoprotein (pyridoxamine 5'-phosphate oxidase superfamily)